MLPLPLGLLLFHFCFYLTYVSIFLPGLVIFEGRKKEGKEKEECRGSYHQAIYGTLEAEYGRPEERRGPGGGSEHMPCTDAQAKRTLA